MTDITIPAHEAKNLADFLRRNGIGEHHPLIRLLDPPVPSLRDEVADAIRESYRQTGGWPEHADAVLAVVRRHVEALHPMLLVERGTAGWLDRDDVLRLLDGESDD